MAGDELVGGTPW